MSPNDPIFSNHERAVIAVTSAGKVLLSPDYNYAFRKDTGLFVRWGRTLGDDPDWSRFGPEIADIEISKDGCPGVGQGVCAYCYKSSTGAPPRNMTLAQFERILSALGPQLTQVAFGITGVKTNPEFFAMMQHCRDKGVVPNFTLSGSDLDDDLIPRIAELAGAVAVSFHGDYALCLSTVKRLHVGGVAQVNIHAVTVESHHVLGLISALCFDSVARDALNALVLLSLKPKGRAVGMTNITESNLRFLVESATNVGIRLGFDSCSAPRALAIFGPSQEVFIDPCESGLFSAYIDCEGRFHPCSFAEGEWGEGLDVLACKDFLSDIWLAPRVCEWRRQLLANQRNCPLTFQGA